MYRPGSSETSMSWVYQGGNPFKDPMTLHASSSSYDPTMNYGTCSSANAIYPTCTSIDLSPIDTPAHNNMSQSMWDATLIRQKTIPGKTRIIGNDGIPRKISQSGSAEGQRGGMRAPPRNRF